MTWEDILKNPKKTILDGLSVLQQNITPNMLEPTGGGNSHVEFTIDKEIDGFYFGRVLVESIQYSGRKGAISMIKELKDSNLMNWRQPNLYKNPQTIPRLQLYYAEFRFKQYEEIDIEIKRMKK